MKAITLLISLLLFTLNVEAQIVNPIKWKFSQKQVNDSVSELKFTATLESGWHLYSQYTPDGGPLPTVFDFTIPKQVKRMGKVSEPAYEKKYEEVFGVDVYTFPGTQVVFTQRVQNTTSDEQAISGEINGMTCKDEAGCIPMDPTSFKFTIPGKTANAISQTPVDTAEVVVVADTVQKKPKSADGNCRDYTIEGLVKNEKKEAESQSYWWIFFLGFGGGLVALLTPCVFPMIPLTVSFFTKSAENRRKGLMLATLYGLSIAAIYALIAVPFIVFRIPPDTLNEIATSAWLNIAFFVVFVAFAISFFGYYEITLPSSLANKADSASNIGGIVGVFFMAITLALVSFSCTGPILGSFLAGTLATNPDPYNILFVMLGFGTALGLPFALFAAFPAWLNTLPKSGGWLNSVKVVLGFLELGMALKFISNADLVEQWGLLKRELFLGIWAVLAFALAAYLLGFIKFPHDGKLKKRTPIRYALSAFFVASGIYFTSGVFGAGLELISGFPPPMFYSYAAQGQQHEEANGDNAHCPQGIPCEHDFEVARERARIEKKPILIDFTGWACVNCRRMEESVWIDPAVKKLMSEEYVLVSLYVDEKKELPAEEQFVSCITERNVTTVGNKWSNLQLVNFNTNSQPQYIALSADGKILTEPVGYTSKEKYLQFLKAGLDAAKK
jgi:thiol:disulfide interchange protein